MQVPTWWKRPWNPGSEHDPDTGWPAPANGATDLWQHHDPTSPTLTDESILGPLEEQFGQVRSRDRVRDLAEVFTHQREVDAMLELIPDAFGGLDVKFLEPACGSGNFLVEILRRKLRLVRQSDCVSQEQYEHQLLRAIASIYGVDISPENVTEARARMAHVLLSHYQTDANTIAPSTGFLTAAAVIIGDNIVIGDTLNAADQVAGTHRVVEVGHQAADRSLTGVTTSREQHAHRVDPERLRNAGAGLFCLSENGQPVRWVVVRPPGT